MRCGCRTVSNFWWPYAAWCVFKSKPSCWETVRISFYVLAQIRSWAILADWFPGLIFHVTAPVFVVLWQQGALARGSCLWGYEGLMCQGLQKHPDVPLSLSSSTETVGNKVPVVGTCCGAREWTHISCSCSGHFYSGQADYKHLYNAYE